MRAWNRKRKPKHCTKPKWKEEYIPLRTLLPCILLAREIKKKYKDIGIYSYKCDIGKVYASAFKKFEILKKEPKIKIVGINRNL